MKKPGKNIAKQTRFQRISVKPEGGFLAIYGFYAPPVQKVVRKWQPKMRQDWIEEYFYQVAWGRRRKRLEFNVPFADHWLFVWQIGIALERIYSNEKSPCYWLLKWSLHVATNGKWDSWSEVSKKIKVQGGVQFSPGTLATYAKRLRLITPPNPARDVQSIHYHCGFNPDGSTLKGATKKRRVTSKKTRRLLQKSPKNVIGKSPDTH